MKVRLVDHSEQRTKALLRWLQLEVLPYDEPLSTDFGWWWVATKDTLPVAFAGLHMSSQWADAAYLCRAGVVSAARGQGLQKRLIQVRERKAKALGLRWLITDTSNNPASANSLIGRGFKMFNPSAPWGLPTASYWRKDLQR